MPCSCCAEFGGAKLSPPRFHPLVGWTISGMDVHVFGFCSRMHAFSALSRERFLARFCSWNGVFHYLRQVHLFLRSRKVLGSTVVAVVPNQAPTVSRIQCPFLASKLVSLTRYRSCCASAASALPAVFPSFCLSPLFLAGCGGGSGSEAEKGIVYHDPGARRRPRRRASRCVQCLALPCARMPQAREKKVAGEEGRLVHRQRRSHKCRAGNGRCLGSCLAFP